MAQLDSASDSDSDGWRFESVWVRHTKTFVSAKVFFMLAKRIQYLLLTRLTLRVAIAITLALLATSPLNMSAFTFRLYNNPITLALLTTNPFGCAIKSHVVCVAFLFFAILGIKKSMSQGAWGRMLRAVLT